MQLPESEFFPPISMVFPALALFLSLFLIRNSSLAFNDIGDQGASAFASLFEKNFTLASVEFVILSL